MQEQQHPRPQPSPPHTLTKKKGFYAKELASFDQKQPEFKRSKKKEIKKENKMACKDARQRKKQYIHTLEQQRNQLLLENQKLKSEISTLKQHLEQAKITGGTGELDQRTKMLATEFRELMIGLNRENKVSISRSLSVLRDKFGISGRERKRWIDESLLRTIELTMPLHFRVLIQNVQDPYKFFELLGGTEEMRNYRLHFDESQKAILKKMKPSLKKAKQNFNRLFLKLHSVWTELTRYSHQTQRIIDSIQDNLDPIFVGNLLVNLDSKRCTSQQIKQIYPINFFKGIPDERESSYSYQLVESDNFIESEDDFAFDMFFEP